MSERPGLLSERSSVRPGSPVIAISSGTVTKRSTSSGERPSASVAICTWTLVTSGNASTESRRAACTPNARRASARTTTMTRCRSAAWTSPSSKLVATTRGAAAPRAPQGWSVSFSASALQCALAALVVEVERAVDDDLVVGAETGGEHADAVVFLAEGHLAERERVGRGLDEDVVAVLVAHDRARRDDALFLRRALDQHGREHRRFVFALRVRDVHAHADGAGFRTDDDADEGQDAADAAVGDRRNLDFHRLPGADRGRDRFRHVGDDPHLGESSEERRVGTEGG